MTARLVTRFRRRDAGLGCFFGVADPQPWQKRAGRRLGALGGVLGAVRRNGPLGQLPAVVEENGRFLVVGVRVERRAQGGSCSSALGSLLAVVRVVVRGVLGVTLRTLGAHPVIGPHTCPWTATSRSP